MKEATIHLSLTKDHQVTVKRVTPIEALLLAAEHHKNVGGNPVEVDKATVQDTTHLAPDGKWVKDNPDRTDDEEIDRLRTKYHKSKVDNIVQNVRTFPKDYEEAVKKGINLVMPATSLSTAELKK